MARKDIYCYKWENNKCKFIGIVDDYVSCFIKRSYTGIGKFELHINGRSNNINLLKQTEFIKIGNGVCGIVNTIEQTKSSKETFVITGTELKGIAEKRIIIPASGSAYQSYTNQSPEYIMAQLINQQIINAANDRQIAGTIAAYVESTTRIDYNGRFENVGVELSRLAETYNIGWYADINASGEIEWHIFHGINRTASQSTNNRLLISDKFDNIKESQYKQSLHPTTTLLVAGQGEGAEREIVFIGNSISNFARSEVYIDARDVEQTADLYTRGNEKLAAYGDSITMCATPEDGILIKQYRIDYDLGDIGTLLDFNEDVRITEIEEVYEDGESALHFTFGYDKKTISAVLQNITTKTESVIAKEGYGGGGIDFNMIYPVGSIYMNTNPTNPQTLFGIGTWERIQDKFLLSAGSTYSAGSTGGSATNNHNHRIAEHYHDITHKHTEGTLRAAIGAVNDNVNNIGYVAAGIQPDGRGPATCGAYNFFVNSASSTSRKFNHYTNVYGQTSNDTLTYTWSAKSARDGTGTAAYSREPSDTNNMPPYLAVYVWKRTA